MKLVLPSGTVRKKHVTVPFPFPVPSPVLGDCRGSPGSGSSRRRALGVRCRLRYAWLLTSPRLNSKGTCGNVEILTVKHIFDLVSFLCSPLTLQGYDNTESSVRKASVFCLVAIYSVIGEELKPHLAQLTGSKVRILLQAEAPPGLCGVSALVSALRTHSVPTGCVVVGPISPKAFS